MTTVEHGGLTFDSGTLDGFHLARLIGWYDAAPTRYDAPDRPNGHGTFRPGTVYRGARVITIEGTWTGRSLEDAYWARQQMAALPSDESKFTVTDPLGATHVFGALARAPQMDDDVFSPFFSFAYELIASDPFRYGAWSPVSTGIPTASTGLSWPLGANRVDDDVSPTGLSPEGYPPITGRATAFSTAGLIEARPGAFIPRAVEDPVAPAPAPFWDWGTDGVSGRVTARNAGTAETYSTFEVTGGLTGGFVLTWVPTGAEIRFTRPILEGSTVYLNPRTGRATIDGQSDVSGFLVKSEWWPVRPGEVGEVQFTPLGFTSGTPTLTVRTADTFA